MSIFGKWDKQPEDVIVDLPIKVAETQHRYLFADSGKLLRITVEVEGDANNTRKVEIATL